MTTQKLQLQAVVSSTICALCFILGVITLKWIAPDLYQFPQGRLRVILEFGWLLHLWHFAVFPLLGLAVFFLNRAFVKQSPTTFQKLAILCTVVSFLNLSHDTTMFIIETMSNEILIRRHFDNDYMQAQLTIDIYAIVNKLRASTEWGIDLWLFLINVLLLLQRRFHFLLQLWGIAVGILGMMVLNDAYNHLSMVYLFGMITWFMLTSIWLIFEKQQPMLKTQMKAKTQTQ